MIYFHVPFSYLSFVRQLPPLYPLNLLHWGCDALFTSDLLQRLFYSLPSTLAHLAQYVTT